MNTKTRFDQLPIGSYFYICTTTSGKQNICFYRKVGPSDACRCEVQEGIVLEVYTEDIRVFTSSELVTMYNTVSVRELEAVIVAIIDERFGKVKKKAEDLVSKLNALARKK